MVFRNAAWMAVALSMLLGLSNAQADTYLQQVNGRQLVVHTNAAPVIVHRLLPPFYGKHVTERQLKVGRLPPAARR